MEKEKDCFRIPTSVIKKLHYGFLIDPKWNMIDKPFSFCTVYISLAHADVLMELCTMDFKYHGLLHPIYRAEFGTEVNQIHK